MCDWIVTNAYDFCLYLIRIWSNYELYMKNSEIFHLFLDRFSLGYNTDSEKEKFVLYSAVMSMISFQTFACLLYFTTIPHKQPLYFQRLINEQKTSLHTKQTG